MDNNQKNNPNSHGQSTKKEALIQYVSTSKYIEIDKQLSICKRFGLPYLKEVFRKIYRERFYDFLLIEPTTVATVENKTGIPHKYLTECKKYYEDKNLLIVIGLGTCPTTKSKNVQFVSTNPNLINGKSSFNINNQTSMF